MTILYTDRNNIPYPDEPEAPADVAEMFRLRALVQDLFLKVETGPLGGRPESSFGHPGYPRLYVTTGEADSPRLDWDYGTGWQTVAGKPMAPVIRNGLTWDHDYTPTYPNRSTSVSLEAQVNESDWSWFSGTTNQLIVVQGLVTLGLGASPVLVEQVTGGQWWWWWYYQGFPFQSSQIISLSIIVPPGGTYRAHMSWAQAFGGSPPTVVLNAREQVI